MKESQILYQAGDYWIKQTPAGFELFRNGAVYATSLGEAYADLSLAKARADYLECRQRVKEGLK